MAGRRTRLALLVAGALGWAGVGCATSGDDGWDVPPPDGGDTGACPGGCPPGQTCVGGRCVASTCGGAGCPAGQNCCDGVCIDLRNDRENCGACGTVCAPQGNACFAGTCACNGAAACAAHQSCCEGLGCVETLANREHCGGCFQACDPGVECLAGACGGSCATGCPDVPHGHTACAGTTCAISECDDGWADVDGLVGNGCECEVVAEPPGGDTCDTAIDLGSVSDTGESLEASGTVIPVDDADWYRFGAADTQPAGCDRFYVDIRFAENPDDQFAFEVFVGDCATSLCRGDVLFTYATDFSTTGSEILGECPCSTTVQPSLNLCEDSSKTFFVKVRRASVTSGGSCAGYRLVISNGMHSTASP
jgi:hypothetical protein